MGRPKMSGIPLKAQINLDIAANSRETAAPTVPRIGTKISIDIPDMIIPVNSNAVTIAGRPFALKT
jgi:hypothetical protein